MYFEPIPYKVRTLLLKRVVATAFASATLAGIGTRRHSCSCSCAGGGPSRVLWRRRGGSGAGAERGVDSRDGDRRRGHGPDRSFFFVEGETCLLVRARRGPHCHPVRP